MILRMAFFEYSLASYINLMLKTVFDGSVTHIGPIGLIAEQIFIQTLRL